MTVDESCHPISLDFAIIEDLVRSFFGIDEMDVVKDFAFIPLRRVGQTDGWRVRWMLTVVETNVNDHIAVDLQKCQSSYSVPW